MTGAAWYFMRNKRTWREVREHALAELRRAEEMRIAAAEEESREETECQKDTERLDWIQSEFHPMEIDVFPDRCFITFFGIDEVRYSAPTLREALDKAINGDEPDKQPSYRLNNDQE